MMRTEPTDTQRTLAGVLGLGLAGLLGLWLMLSYFGVWTSDAKVSVEVTEVGDAIGPGSKVRYHGIIVGRVLRLEDTGDGYQLKLLVGEEHARSIPRTATARILPGTVFGSEYVELLSERDARGGDHVASGDVIRADVSESTLRLMAAFDSAERLISAIDAEDLNRITGKLAPALDGNGADIKAFLERADRVVTEINDDLPTTWQSLSMVPAALDTIADITPDLVSAAQSSQATSRTIASRSKQIGDLLGDGTRVIDRGHALVEANRDVLVPFVRRLERLTGLVADNSGSLQSILTNFAAVGHNGANGIDDNAIQMIGTIGTDLLEPYTAADCTRYGPTLVATNCGDPVPEQAPQDDEVDARALAAQIGDLLGGPAAARPDTSAQDDDGPTPTTAPTTPAGGRGIGGLLGLLGLGRGGA